MSSPHSPVKREEHEFEGQLADGACDLSRDAGRRRTGRRRRVFEPDRLPLRRPSLAAVSLHWAGHGNRRPRHPVRQCAAGLFCRLTGAGGHPVRFRFRHAAQRLAPSGRTGTVAGDHRRPFDHWPVRRRRLLSARSQLAGILSARGCCRLDRRGSSVLPVARRRDQFARTRAFHARGGIRHQ